MCSLNADLAEYQAQLQKGTIQKAYRGLMDYILSLKSHLGRHFPEYTLPGGLYFGYMDMTYFSIVSESLKQRQLKIAIVFVHKQFRFEIWLAAVNKRVQARYWQLIRESGWDQYRLVPSLEGADSIVEHVLVKEPDFSDPDALTRQIEENTLKFIRDVETFLVGIQK